MLSINKIKNKWNKAVLMAISALLLSPVLFAQTAATSAGPAKSSMSNPTAITLLVLMILLLVVIGILANVVLNAADYFIEKNNNDHSGAGTKAVALIGMLLLSVSSTMAQTAEPAAAPAVESIAGLTPLAFYLMIGVIAVEVIIIFYMLYFLRSFLRREKERLTPEVSFEVKQKTLTWWDKFNSFRPMQEEANIDLGHDYDGIRELDNRLPPWWLYGFYVCIIFAGIYLYRYHVAHSAPLSAEELQIAMEKGEAEKAAYLKSAANLVDENTVKLLTDPASIEEGNKIFHNPAFCVACHRADGGGNVGPNLTDDYWIYGGSIKDVFKTIKYGTNKGMKSWKDDLTPLQIQQVASYVLSLRGSNPKDPKAPQGELYKEAAPAADSAAAKKAVASSN
jgi:cytochrome c oxidase cbb3-type subunit 3